MMRTKLRHITLECLSDMTIEEIVNTHIRWVVSEHFTYDADSISVYSPEAIKKVEIKGKPKPQRGKLYERYAILLHCIISRCRMSSHNQCFLLSADYREIIGRGYFSDMLYNLEQMGIISIGYYKVGQYSRPISLNDWNISTLDTSNRNIIAIYDAIESKGRPTPSYASNKFTDHYNECLSHLQLVKKDEAIKYINDHIEKGTHRYHYYLSRINDFKGGAQILAIDKNNRIYHYLTNLPKVLKPFFNIKLDIDVRNSHPLLFSYFLIKEYNISNDIVISLFNISYNTHYDVNELRNELINKHLDVPSKKDLPNDIIDYIYKVQHGLFYNEFLDIFKDLERSEVKQKVFADVFYTHKRTTHGSAFCEAFRDKYPNVWSLILRLRKEIEKPQPLEKIKVGAFNVPIYDEAKSDNLANRMMRLESEIFHKVLIACWERHICAVNIHDAVIVLDIADSKTIAPDVIKSIIEAIYHSYGLYPSLNIEIG